MKVNVLEKGVVSSKELLQTKKVQELVNSLKEGETLYFPKGDYVIGTIFLKSDMTIEVSKGATIWGAPSFYDYAPQEEKNFPIYQDQSHTYFDCSMFVGKNLKNISFIGEGTIDMRSVWDLDNVRDIVHRGPKCITLVECDNVKMSGLTILNVTDLAVYFVSSTNVEIDGLKLKVYIDGISPDNSKHVVIKNCDVEAGDDGVVFKSSYNLNRLDYCDDIIVDNCLIKSRCNPVKFGTESNGGFKNIKVTNCVFRDSRITGIALESVDGAKVENIEFKNIKMYNIGSPFFVYIGKRMRGPKELEIGSIKNVSFENIYVMGPYHVYDCMAWNYVSYVAKDNKQFPGYYSKQVEEPTGTWQITSNICGLPGHKIENISFKKIYMELDGGVKEYNKGVPEEPSSPYPEIYVYGRILPAYGFYFRNVNGVTLEDIKIKLLHEDSREKFVFDNVENIVM